MLEIKDLVVEKPSFQLKNISLSADNGEYLIILGPSGSGKTLLLETILGFNKIKRGKIKIDGKDITYLPPEKRNIGYVPQDYYLFPHLNVYKNIIFGLKTRKNQRLVRKTNIEEEVNRIMRLFKINLLSDRSVNTLSGGEKQRVALARALITRPKVLLLDEPLSALDMNTKISLWKVLKEIHRTTSTIILHVTHNFMDAEALSDKILILFNGEIKDISDRQTLFKRPKTPEIARFIGINNIFPCRIIETHRKKNETLIRWGSKILCTNYYHLRPGTDTFFAISPEHIVIVPPEKQGRIYQENMIFCEIIDRFIYGPFVTLFFKPVDMESILEIQISDFAYYRLKLPEETHRHVYLKKEFIHIFDPNELKT